MAQNETELFENKEIFGNTTGENPATINKRCWLELLFPFLITFALISLIDAIITLKLIQVLFSSYQKFIKET